ncbi:AsmA family protein [bacterium]
MTKESNKKKQHHRWLRRLLKVCLWITGCFLLLLIIAVLFVRVQYPESKVLELISENVQSNTGMPLHIVDISWQIPLRLVISEINLGYPENDLENDVPFISLNRFSVSFRLLPLLKRRLHVQSVTLDQPNVYLDPDQLILLQSISQMDSSSDIISDSSMQSSAVLPFSLGLSRLHLNDFDCTVILPDSLNARSVQITGLNLNINNLHIPREMATSLEGVRGQVHLFTDESMIHYSEDGFHISPKPNINLRAAWGKNQRWQAQGLVDIVSTPDSSQQMRMQVDLNGTGKGDSIHVESFQLDVGEKPALLVKGDIINIIEQPEFRATLESQSINMQKVYALAKAFLPPVMLTMLEPLEIKGDFRLPEGNVWGNVNDIHFQFQLTSALRNGYISTPNLIADSLFYHVNIQGSLETESDNNGSIKFTKGLINGMAGFSDIQLSLNDSTTTQAGPLSLQFESRMDSSGLPTEGYLTGRLSKLLKGHLGMDFKWGLVSDAPKTPESIFVNGSIFADSLDIMEIPNLPSGIKGKLNMKADMVLPNLYQAVIDLGIDIPNLSYTLENINGALPPVHLGSTVALQTEPSFQQVWVDSGFIGLNNIIRGRFNGQMDIQKRAFWIDLKQLVLDHGSVKSYLPAVIQESMEGINFGGYTALTGNLKGLAAQPDSLQIQGVMTMHDGEFRHDKQDLQAMGLHGKITAAGTVQNLIGTGSFGLDSLDLGAMRGKPVKSSLLSFDWQWIADESVSLTEAMFRNDDLNVEAQFRGGIEDIAVEPKVHILGEISFNKSQWVEIVQEMMLQGQTKVQFQVDQKSNPLRLAISGDVIMKELDLNQGELLSIINIRGRVPFQMEMDLENGMIISDSDYSPPSWIDYENRRSQFRSLNPDQGALYVKSIGVAGYELTDLTMDIDIRKGYMQVPWFMVNMFYGNVGGYLQVFLGNGKPETITYEIHAQAARINSAVLGNIPVKKDKETELNATMAFSGLGVDIEKEMEMDGYFYITQIGPQFASLLLRGMDPKGEDRNIRLTRRLLDMGWKPTLFSFEMRHGYVYPSLSLSQPWFSPIRLPETLSFGRLPLKFFLENPEVVQAR